MSRYVLFIAFILLYASCKDCTRYTKGYILDRDNNKPLAGAKISSYAALNDRSRDQRVTYTDNNGFFETAFELDNVAKCGNLKLIIDHPGYSTAYEVDMPQNDTVYLDKIKP
jgi:hypothetical protein